MSRPARCLRRSWNARQRMGHLFTSKRRAGDGPWVILCSWCGKPKP